MPKLLVLTIALLVQLPQQNVQSSQGDAPQMTLAERAAVARKAAAERGHKTNENDGDGPPALTAEQRGAVRGGQYVNDALRCKIDLSSQWQELSAERMARSEATARRLVNPDQQGGSPFRVLWIGDAQGRNVAISVIPVAPSMPSELGEIANKLKQNGRSQLANAENLVEETEPAKLGDVKHQFAAFRLKYTIQGTPLVQSEQVIRKNGFLMIYTATGSSDQDVTEALQSLKARLSWSD
jgi:hypothetical protein